MADFTLPKERVELGKGGFGSVFKVVRERDGEHLAAKSFIPCKGDGALTTGTIRELSILLALSRESGANPHPNIVRVVAATEIEGVDGLCMVMPLACISLWDAIASKSLRSREEKLSIGLDLLQALEYLNANWIIHRDLKPGNVLISHGGRAVLAEFSLAKVLVPPLPGAKEIDYYADESDSEGDPAQGTEPDADSPRNPDLNTGDEGDIVYRAPYVPGSLPRPIAPRALAREGARFCPLCARGRSRIAASPTHCALHHPLPLPALCVALPAD
jgi:serine/threonine protein kinase